MSSPDTGPGRPPRNAARASKAEEVRFDGASTGEYEAEKKTQAALELMAEARKAASSQAKPPPPPNARAKLAALFASALFVYWCMVMTPKPMDEFSDVWQRVMYLPVIGASLMFGFRAGLAMAAFVAGLCAWHIATYWGGDFLGANLRRATESGLILVIGGLTGYLSELLRRESHRGARTAELLDRASRLLLDTSQDLGRSMDKLKHGAYEMMALQQRLQRADRLAALGTLTAGLAHEIRNPLGSIKGTAEILADRVGGDEVAKEFAGILILEADRLNETLTNFLRFARGSRFAGDSCDPCRAMSEVVELVQPHFARGGARLEAECLKSEPQQAAISGGSLRQVLFNLLLNARDALEHWEGERLVRVRCGVCHASDQICLEVLDSGPGIPDDARAKIFDPFYTTKDTGTGLGLAIAARIMDDARGELTLAPRELSPLGGALFVVKIPKGAAEGSDPGPSLPDADAPRKTA